MEYVIGLLPPPVETIGRAKRGQDEIQSIVRQMNSDDGTRAWYSKE